MALIPSVRSESVRVASRRKVRFSDRRALLASAVVEVGVLVEVTPFLEDPVVWVDAVWLLEDLESLR